MIRSSTCFPTAASNKLWLLVTKVNFVFPVSTFTKGEQMLPVLNKFGTHCAVFGNHDFGKKSFTLHWYLQCLPSSLLVRDLFLHSMVQIWVSNFRRKMKVLNIKVLFYWTKKKFIEFGNQVRSRTFECSYCIFTDFGIDTLVDFSSKCDFPWLMSNVTDNETGRPLADRKISHVVEWWAIVKNHSP